MRLFVSFRDAVHSYDVDHNDTVGDIKDALRERFGLNLKNSRNETISFVSLVYQGSSLHDEWTYSDLGIPSGATLLCRIDKQVDPTLIVRCTNYEETIVYQQSFDVWATTVGTLRGMIQDSTGIHVSAFRLYSESGLELFDCHPLKVYGIDTGDTVAMEIWRDVADVIRAARDNDITGTLGSLAPVHERPHLMHYQLRLGLFIAAHFGYHQLATQLMKYGARPDEPVGLHPSRAWCRASAHVDHMKTPAHEAAQHGRLKCLQHFLMFNYAVLVCKDANGLTPCNLARRSKQTECFKLLVAEQFRIPSVHPELSIHVYARVRKWCDRARLRARVHKDKTAVLLLANAEVLQKRAVVGQRVEVDGCDGFERCDRNVKSAPSCLTPCRARATVSTQHSDPGHYTFADHPNAGLHRPVRRTRSDASAKADNDDQTSISSRSVSPKLVRKLDEVKSKRQNSNTRQNSRELGSPRSRNSRAVNTRVEYEPSRRERARSKLGNSGQEQKSRYIWKSLDTLDDERISRDGSDARPNADNHDPLKSHSTTNDTISGREISVNGRHPIEGRHREGIGTGRRTNVKRDYGSSVVSPSNTDEPPKLTDRSGVGTGRREVSESTMSRESGLARKGATRPQTDSILVDTHPLNRRSAQSRNLLYQRSLESSAEKCLRVACETFRKKSWLGQVQMALVVNTNMCKRRHNALMHSDAWALPEH